MQKRRFAKSFSKSGDFAGWHFNLSSAAVEDGKNKARKLSFNHCSSTVGKMMIMMMMMVMMPCTPILFLPNLTWHLISWLRFGLRQTIVSTVHLTLVAQFALQKMPKQTRQGCRWCKWNPTCDRTRKKLLFLSSGLGSGWNNETPLPTEVPKGPPWRWTLRLAQDTPCRASLKVQAARANWFQSQWH